MLSVASQGTSGAGRGSCAPKVVRLRTADDMETGLHTDSTRATGEVAVNRRPCALCPRPSPGMTR